MDLKYRKMLFMAKNDTIANFPFFVIFLPIEKTQKWNILMGNFYFSIFPLLMENENYRTLKSIPLNFQFFYVGKKWKNS